MVVMSSPGEVQLCDMALFDGKVTPEVHRLQ